MQHLTFPDNVLLLLRKSSAETQTCTGDARLFRPALYYLSYLGEIFNFINLLRRSFHSVGVPTCASGATSGSYLGNLLSYWVIIVAKFFKMSTAGYSPSTRIKWLSVDTVHNLDKYILGGGNIGEETLSGPDL